MTEVLFLSVILNLIAYQFLKLIKIIKYKGRNRKNKIKLVNLEKFSELEVVLNKKLEIKIKILKIILEL